MNYTHIPKCFSELSSYYIIIILILIRMKHQTRTHTYIYIHVIGTYIYYGNGQFAK